VVAGEPISNENRNSSRQLKISQMSNELKYAIVMTWSDIKNDRIAKGSNAILM